MCSLVPAPKGFYNKARKAYFSKYSTLPLLSLIPLSTLFSNSGRDSATPPIAEKAQKHKSKLRMEIVSNMTIYRFYLAQKNAAIVFTFRSSDHVGLWRTRQKCRADLSAAPSQTRHCVHLIWAPDAWETAAGGSRATPAAVPPGIK